eukprot:7352437-Prorocentrum_lima.AAC.1
MSGGTYGGTGGVAAAMRRAFCWWHVERVPDVYTVTTKCKNGFRDGQVRREMATVLRPAATCVPTSACRCPKCCGVFPAYPTALLR